MSAGILGGDTQFIVSQYVCYSIGTAERKVKFREFRNVAEKYEDNDIFIAQEEKILFITYLRSIHSRQ